MVTPPTTASHRPHPAHHAALATVVIVIATLLAGCLGVAGDTSQITKIDEATVGGWHFDYYRNTAYPCSIAGYQTFAIGTKVGSSATATRPLWVKMRGGGAGWFDPDGTPEPTAGVKSEIPLTELLSFDDNGLMAKVEAAPEGFRVMLVSMCSHDVYGGMNTPDPGNPNTVPGGDQRPTTGLISVKAAVQYTMAAYPTDDFFLHGTSAGGAGSFHVAWALQRQGLAPAGIVSDSGVINLAWEQYVAEHGINGSEGCMKATDGRTNGLAARIDPEVADPNDQPDRLVARGALTVPIMHVWNHGDQNSCGNTMIPCPLPDGSTPQLTAADCRHEPLRLAIAAQGAASRSVNMGVCVEGGDTSQPCDRHVVTAGKGLTNSDLASAPADFQTAIMAWVRARLADD